MGPTAQPDLTPAAPPQRPTGIYPTADGGREVVIGEEHVGASREAIVAALQAPAPDLSVTLDGDGIRIGWAAEGAARRAAAAGLTSTRKMKGGKSRRPGKRAPRLPTRATR